MASGYVFQQCGEGVRQSVSLWVPTSCVPPGVIIECEILCQQHAGSRLEAPGENELFALFGMLTPEQLSAIWIAKVGIKVCSIEFEFNPKRKFVFGLQAVPYV